MSYKDKVGTLYASDYKGIRNECIDQDKVIVQSIVSFDHDERSSQMTNDGTADTLTANDYKQPTTVSYAVDCRNGLISDVNGTLQAKESGGTSLNLNNVVKQAVRRIRYIVRRLTPLEATRLQGYPDGWVDIGDWTDSKGKKHKANDSEKYRALGNSIALPSWAWVLERMAGYYDRPATMASLFDGIGGFPLCWERIHGKGTAIWASEIEEFPIAVTKIHFPEGDEDEHI